MAVDRYKFIASLQEESDSFFAVENLVPDTCSLSVISPNVKHSVKLHWLGSSFSAMLTVGPLARSSNPRSEIGSASHYHQIYEQRIWSLDPLTPYIPSTHWLFVSLILRELI